METNLLTPLLILSALLITGTVMIRFGCHYKTIPWPWWLAWFLENPYMQVVCNKHQLTRRLDLKRGMRVLDVGCGAGRISIPVANAIGATGHVDAVDMQSRMLKQLMNAASTQGVDNISPHQIDLQTGLKALPCRKYDRILLTTVIGEIPDRRSVLIALKERLKPNGRIVVTEVLPDPCFVTHRQLLQTAKQCGLGQAKHIRDALKYTVELTPT